MNFTDLIEVKKMLEIDLANTSEDTRLLLFIEQVSSWIEQYLNRSIFLKTRTEYYKGTGTQRLLLKSRPVFINPLPQVWVDGGANYGATSGAFQQPQSMLTWGYDFTLDIDDGIDTSKSGILIRINALWPKPSARQAGYLSPFIIQDTGSIKVTYYAGYSIDSLPAQIRAAANLMVANYRYVFPLGLPLNSESYEDRNISISADQKTYLMSLAAPMLFSFRNWKFG